MKIIITENKNYDPLVSEVRAYASLTFRGIQINNIQILKYLSPLTWRISWPHYRNAKGSNQAIVYPTSEPEKAMIESSILHQCKLMGLK